MCPDETGNLVKRKLNFTTKHELLSYSLATNVPRTLPAYYECRKGDGRESITKLVKKFVNNLMQISDRSFFILSNKYNDMLEQLSDAIERETEYNERQNLIEKKVFFVTGITT